MNFAFLISKPTPILVKIKQRVPFKCQFTNRCLTLHTAIRYHFMIPSNKIFAQLFKITSLLLYECKRHIIMHYICIILVDEFALGQKFYIIPPVHLKITCRCFRKSKWFREFCIIMLFDNFSQCILYHTSISCQVNICLLYTSDAADEEDSVDLGGR